MKTILDDSVLLERLSGLAHTDFVRLRSIFHDQWEARHHNATVLGRERQRFRRREDEAHEESETMFLLILFYYHWFPTQKALGALMGKTQQWAAQWIGHLTPVAERTLGRPLAVPDRKPLTLDALLVFVPALRACVEPPEFRQWMNEHF